MFNIHSRIGIHLFAFAALAAAGSGSALSQISPEPPHGAGHKPNRLARESSPYLLQHAHNPVDWYPWGAEAFERAKKEDKPIFLSVGYAACHWCHVMERESFQNEEIAKLLNESFVCVKVDREERPDVDDVYMSAVQMMTGRGGWPMSVLMTPDGRPFFGGTYFRPDDFKTLITRAAEVWKTRRVDIEKSADEITVALQRRSRLSASGGSVDAVLAPALQKELLAALRETYDAKHGGFSSAPKFPPHNSFPFLFEYYAATKDPEALRLTAGTLDAMARGGIRDHLGGGFHRYSTDAEWKLPHFEKMLYDNALLARAYAEAHRITRKPLYAEVARETLDWAIREMRGPEGGFYSSLDADSEGEEGRFYLWSYAEIIEVLGRDDGRLFTQVYDVHSDGNFVEQGSGKRSPLNVLALRQPPREIPRKRSPTETASCERHLKTLRAKLMAARAKRVRPGLDDKRLTGWNALMISSLARCGVILKEPRYTTAAKEAARFVLRQLARDGKLLRRWRPSGAPGSSAAGAPAAELPGFLEDYAYLVSALLDLHQATGETSWRTEADRLTGTMISLFAAPEGGFYETPAGHETLLFRARNPFDQALPAPNAIAIQSLVRLAKLTGKKEYLVRAATSLKALGGRVTESPRAGESMVLAAEMVRRAFRGSESRAASKNVVPPTIVLRGPVRVSASLQTHKGSSEVVVRLEIEEGWHVNAAKPLDAALIPTRVEVIEPVGAAAGPAQFPAPETVKLGFSAQPMAVYTGPVDIRIPVRKPFKGMRVRVRFQACDENACEKPETVIVSVR